MLEIGVGRVGERGQNYFPKINQLQTEETTLESRPGKPGFSPKPVTM